MAGQILEAVESRSENRNEVHVLPVLFVAASKKTYFRLNFEVWPNLRFL